MYRGNGDEKGADETGLATVFEKEDACFKKEQIKEIFKFGIATSIQQSNLYIGKIFIQGAINTLDIASIAAYTAGTKIESFINSVGNSGELAISVMIAQNYGAKNYGQVEKAGKEGIKLMFVIGVIMSVMMFITAEITMGLFINENDCLVLEYGVEYLQVISGFYILCLVGNALVGYFKGTGHVDIPLKGTTISIFIRVILSYLMIKYCGIRAVALATGMGWIAVVSFHVYSYQKICKKIRMSV